MAVVYTDIQELAPEFSALSQARIDPFIRRASLRTDVGFWGPLYNDAVLYLAAHLLAMAEPPSDKVGGSITSETAGPLSRSRGAVLYSGIPGEYAGSAWGREYYSLLRGLRFQSIQAI